MNSIGQTVFELESGNENVDGQTNRQKTDKRTDRITPISKGVFELESRNENVVWLKNGLTNRIQTCQGDRSPS